MMTAEKPQTLQGRQDVCRICKRPIVWARTVATANGPGGKAMPLNPEPDDAGNVAVRVGIGGRLFARVLLKGETHDRTSEHLAMPHFATCGKELVGEIEDFLATHAGGPT